MIKKILNSGLSFLWLTIFVLILDRCTKIWAIQHLTLYEPFKILPIFNLTLSYNRGAAFGFLHNAAGWQNLYLGIFAAIVCLGILSWLAKAKVQDYLANIALTLILGGALGNVWDRIIYGYVTDFLSFHYHDWHFAIFNIADSAICLGAILLACTWLFNKPNIP